MDRADIISKSEYRFRTNQGTINVILDLYNCILENLIQKNALVLFS